MEAAGALATQDAQQAASAGAISGVASKLSIFSGTGTAVFGSFTGEFFLAAVGAIGTIGSLLVNAWFKRRQARLAQRRLEFDMEMARRAEERRLMEAQARIEVMRESGSLMAPPPDTTPPTSWGRLPDREGA